MIDTPSKILALAQKDFTLLEKLVREFPPEYFPQQFREYAKLLYEVGVQYRTPITKDILNTHCSSKTYTTEQIVSLQKTFADCDVVPCKKEEFEFFFTDLKKNRAERVLREALNGLDESGNKIKLKGKEVKSVVDLIKDEKDPWQAALVLKKALSDLEKLNQKDPIIRVKITERAEQKIRDYDERKVDKTKSIGILTGLGPLDDMTRGMHPGEMFLAGGRPGSGKSVILVNVAKNIIRSGKSVQLFSLEMPYEQYEDRFIACFAEINYTRMLLGALNPDEEKRLKDAWTEVRDYRNQMEIVDFPKMNGFKIETELMRALDDFHPDVSIIDYLGIMTPNDKGSTADWEAQGRIAEEVRAVARLYKIPTMSAVQMNRSKDKNPDADRVSRSDVIGQTADCIFLIKEREKNENELSDIMKFAVVKNRKGQSDFEFDMFRNFETITVKNPPHFKSNLATLLAQ